MGLKGKTKSLNLNEDERYINIESIKILNIKKVNIDVVLRIYESKEKRDLGINNFIGKDIIRIYYQNEIKKDKKVIKELFDPISLIDKKDIYKSIYDHIKNDENIITEVKDA